MVRSIVLAVVVAVAVSLGCLLIGALLQAINLDVAMALGSFLSHYSAAIGILAGIWYFFTHGFTTDRRAIL